jgi:hypothetical protein
VLSCGELLKPTSHLLLFPRQNKLPQSAQHNRQRNKFPKANESHSTRYLAVSNNNQKSLNVSKSNNMMEYDLTSGSSPISLIKQYINSRPTTRSYNNAQEKLFHRPLLCTDPSFSSVAFLLFPLSIDALSAASLLRRSPLSSIALLSSPSLSPQPLISTSTSSLLRRSPLSLPLFVTILFPLFFSVSLLLRLAVHRSPSPSFSYSVVLILCALSVGLLLRCSFLQPSPPPLSLCCAFLHRFLTSLSLLRSYPPSFSLHR